MIARRHGVPVSAIMQANNITSPAMVRPGQHLVIPRYRSGPGASVAAEPRYTSTVASVAAPVGPPRSALAAPSSVHIVAPGETLNSIARLYNKPVMVLAKVNNIPPTTMVRVGDRIVIPDVREQPRAVASAAPVMSAPPMTSAPPRTQPAITQSGGPSLASQDSSAERARCRADRDHAGFGRRDYGKDRGAADPPGFRWPVRGRVIQAFGPKPNGLQNDGINLAVPEGTPVKAADDGVVAYAGNELKGYGNLVLVRHANGFVTAYAHASDILVKRGDSVKRGQVIAHSGQTGNVTSPQLHFEIRKGATPVDPAQYLSGCVTDVRRLMRSELPRALHAKPARQILHILPRDAAGARAARRRPFERFAAQLVRPRSECGAARYSPRPWRDIRPGCSGGSRATARSGPTARLSPRRPRRD